MALSQFRKIKKRVNDIKLSQIQKKEETEGSTYSPLTALGREPSTALTKESPDKEQADTPRSFENLAVPLTAEEERYRMKSQNHHMSNTCAVLDQFSHGEFYEYYKRVDTHKKALQEASQKAKVKQRITKVFKSTDEVVFKNFQEARRHRNFMKTTVK